MSGTCDTRPTVLIGLPYAAAGPLADALVDAGGSAATTLYSVNAFWRAGRGFTARVPSAVWRGPQASLDSAGFTAMVKFGGYRFTPDEYVEWLADAAFGDVEADEGGTGSAVFPFTFWSAMDYCCEEQIAADRAEIEARMERNATSYGECLRAWGHYAAHEGYGLRFPEPMLILQGRTPADYVRSARTLGALRRAILVERHRGTSIAAELEYGPAELAMPALIGLGSVCRRDVEGPQGILPVLRALDAELPGYVQLHLFGVKGETVDALGPLASRVRSMDSMAWSYQARMAALGAYQKAHGGAKPPKGTKLRTTKKDAAFLRRWAAKQYEKIAALPTAQRPLSPGEVADVREREIVATFMDARRSAPPDLGAWMDEHRPALMDEIEASLRRR